MTPTNKSEDDPASEIESLKKRITELEAMESDRKRGEEDLRASEEKFRTIFDNTADGIIMIDLEKNIFVDANKSMRQMLGYSLEELKKLGISDIHPKEDLPFILDQIKKQSEDGSSSASDIRTTRKDRGIFYASVRGTPMNLSGKNYLVGIFRDITERKRLEENNEKLSRAAEQSPFSIVITNTKAEIEYANSFFCNTTGYSLEEAKGQNPRILKSGTQSSEFYKNMWKIITAGNEWKGEFHNKKKNGELYWESAVISPLKDVNGHIVSYVAVKEDITERKKMEEDARLRLKELEVFYKASIGREERILELKKEIEMLKRELGK